MRKFTYENHDPDLCKDSDCLDDRCEFRRNDAPAERHHVTRTVAAGGGLRGAFGHSTRLCNPAGCAGLEQYLGQYDPEDVDHDGEDFTATTETGNLLLLRAP